MVSQRSAGESAQLRAYGGEDGGSRVARRRTALIESALDLLGAPEPAPVTVRGVCARAGLTPRYFYESFTGVDDLVGAAYDEVIAEFAERGQVAFASTQDPRRRVARAVRAIVDVVDDDARKGRLVFSDAPVSPVVAAKRGDSLLLFVALTADSAQEALGLSPGPEVTAAAHFQVGGLSRLLASWIEGTVQIDKESLIGVCVGMLLPNSLAR
ncbi:TetR/AcrR family transcriptional regulator [Gordonia sp. VNK21]|uniref:TetR/AcrR family transcriptional regulator n=1 Tax=Gordonia sp. VNK21 TaxID=3382483 RepID=UPI0038D51799